MARDPADSSWSYRPEEDDDLTGLFRHDARLEACADVLLGSIGPADADRVIVPYLLQREFLMKRQARPAGG
jgi:hypothetical protein